MKRRKMRWNLSVFGNENIIRGRKRRIREERKKRKKRKRE